MSALLTIDKASIAYGKVQAVQDVSLTVNKGEIVTVIGANGAGKSTLLNAAMGLLPFSGGMHFGEWDLARLDVEDRVSRGLTLVPEKRELFTTMSVEDNLTLGAFRAPAGHKNDAMDQVYTRFPRLKERRKQLAGTMSGGERQMLAMGRALMNRPKLLMLDEPSLGLAPRIVNDIFAIIKDLRADGVSILVIEQNARIALGAADRAYVMELGEVKFSGPSAELAQDKRIQEIYLGVH
jgi:branched-chain amino acid transport system ATP-binding protein